MATRASIGSLFVELGATTARLQQDLAKGVGLLESFHHDVARVNKLISATFAYQAAKEAIHLIEKFGEQLRELATEGDKLNDLEAAFERFGGDSGVLASAEEKSKSLISSMNLLQIATTGLVKHVQGINEHFDEAAEFAAKFAQATGGDATEALKKLITQMSTHSERAIKSLNKQFQFGIDKADTWAQVWEKIQKRTKELGELDIGAGDSFQILDNRIEKFWEKIEKAVDSNDDFATSLQFLGQQISELDLSGIATLFSEIAAAITAAAGAAVWFANQLAKIPAVDFLKGTAPTSAAGPLAGIAKAIYDYQKSVDGVGESADNAAPKVSDLGDRFFHSKTEAEKAAKELEKLRTSLSRAETDIQKKGLERAIKENLKAFSSAGGSAELFGTFEDNLKNIIGVTAVELNEKWSDALANPQTAAKAKEIILAELGSVENEYRAMWLEGEKERAADTAREQKEALKDTAQFFGDAIYDALNGQAPNIEDIFKRIAAGFAGQLLASMTGIRFDGNFMNLGAQFASSILNGGAGGVAQAGGIAGIAGGLLGGTSAGGFLTGISNAGAIGPVASGAEYGGMLAGSQVSSLMATAAPYAAAAVVAYMGLKHFGVFDSGPRNPDTIARKKAESYLEDKTGRNFIFGPSSRFNTSKGFDYLNSLDSGTKGTFTAFGEGLRASLGITEDIGGQLGAVLAENLNGNLNEAKKLVSELGISMEDMIGGIKKAGFEANKSLLEIQSNIQNVQELYTPGRTGKGDITGAMQDYIASLNKGQDAVLNLKDVFIEAMEAGAQSVEDLRPYLEKIMPTEQVNKFISATKDMGFQNIKELAGASDDTFIALGAHIEAVGFDFEGLAEKIDKTTDSMNRFNEASKGGSSTVPANDGGDKFTTDEARGAKIYIDARNSVPGVHYEVERAVRKHLPRAMQMSVDIVADANRRTSMR